MLLCHPRHALAIYEDGCWRVSSLFRVCNKLILVERMPEGPEVRRFADSVNAALVGKPIVSLTARTRRAKTWLVEHSGVLTQKRIERVRSRKVKN